MTPRIFQDLLIEKIKETGLPVIPYPSNPKDYYPQSDPGEILVRYEGRKPIDHDLSGMKMRVKFFAEIVVVTRELYDDEGAYNNLEIIFKLLEGYKLESMSGQLSLEVESFMDETNGLWQFGQKWSAVTDIYQSYSTDYERNLAAD